MIENDRLSFEDDHNKNIGQDTTASIITQLFTDTVNISSYHNDLDKYVRSKISHIKNRYEQKKTHQKINYIRKDWIEGCRNEIYAYLTLKNIPISIDDIVLDNIDRQQFNADLTIKIPSLIKQYKQDYQSALLPEIIKYIRDSIPYVKSVEQKGIYANITLTDSVFFNMLQQIKQQSDHYGENTNHAGDIIIAEYSSPNAAKHLHAGHIRSTVIGQILGNIYEWNGYEVHRVNHINDWGGFGELIVGYQRRSDTLAAKGYVGNDLSFMVYSIYRKAEKAVTSIRLGEHISPEDSVFLQEYFHYTSPHELEGLFEQYKKESVQAFHQLEAGGEKEFSFRKKIYSDSIASFEEFYKKLGIHHDFVIGESFYEKKGKQIVQEGIEKGVIVHFTADVAKLYYQGFLEEKGQEITDVVKQQKYQEIQQDIGSYVALLDNYERYVVMRSDGASIYATRDLGCLQYRCEKWNPDTIMYEVGQEQADHFNKLFETGKKFGRDRKSDGKKREFLHISHGFYVDEGTKKKLSSRAGANNVLSLLNASQEYFEKGYVQDTTFSAEEIDATTKTLGKSSIIINDVRKVRMSPVYVHQNIDETLAGFEKSGGPYLMYTLCRAKSIMRKHDAMSIIENIVGAIPDAFEVDIIKKIALFPDVIEKAAKTHEPSVIVEYAYQLTQNFNTLYTTKKNLVENVVGMDITRAYVIILTNIFNICNIKPLDRM